MNKFNPSFFQILLLDYAGAEGYVHSFLRNVIYDTGIRGIIKSSDTEDAFEKLLTTSPAINMIIVNMEELSMDAFRFVTMIRKDKEFKTFSEVPVFIVMNEDSKAKDALAAQNIIIEAYLNKPLSNADMIKALSKISG